MEIFSVSPCVNLVKVWEKALDDCYGAEVR